MTTSTSTTTRSSGSPSSWSTVSNEAEILAATTAATKVGGINRLGALLNQLDYPGTDRLTAALGSVQGARSRSAAHRKSSSFDLTALLDGHASLPARFAAQLEAVCTAYAELIAFLDP